MWILSLVWPDRCLIFACNPSSRDMQKCKIKSHGTNTYFLAASGDLLSASKSETSFSSSSARALRSSAVVSFRILLAFALAASALFFSSMAVTNLVVRSYLSLSFARMIYSNSESWEVAGDGCVGITLRNWRSDLAEINSVFGLTSD